MEHKYNYRWTLADTKFTKDKGRVFSCFACGGGSTMGYKLAGFDVIGCNEIDPRMMKAYITNHNPKYAYLEPIQTFKLREDLPKEFYELDILDGSPPCSTFSIAGLREKTWGKKKKFREGQAEQVLDTLFFDFIDLAKKLQPKIVVAENVKGILLGNAAQYVAKIYRDFDLAGYHVQHWLLDASKMGVPQRRERVFFIALRKDLANLFMEQNETLMFQPKINLDFREQEIPFEDISDDKDLNIKDNIEISKYYDLIQYGQSFSTVHPKKYYFSHYKASHKKPLNTICVAPTIWHPTIKRTINTKEIMLAGSFPMDYNFEGNSPNYLVGMSVPPIMMAQIADRIFEYWLSKINIRI